MIVVLAGNADDQMRRILAELDALRVRIGEVQPALWEAEARLTQLDSERRSRARPSATRARPT